MPAEWEPHAATWLAWPHEKTDWPGKFAPIPWVYADIVRHLSQVERVRILVENPPMERAARRILKSAGANLSAVDFFHVPTNRGWIRDFGPIFVRNSKGETAATNWHFNAWAKYDDWKKDDAANEKLAAQTQMEDVVAHLSRAPRRSRRRQHRRERPRHDAHHGGMPAEPDPGAQSRRNAQGTGSHLPRLPRRDEYSLAQKRHRGRRHARPRGRSRALRKSNDRCNRRGERSVGSKFPAACRKI